MNPTLVKFSSPDSIDPKEPVEWDRDVLERRTREEMSYNQSPITLKKECTTESLGFHVQGLCRSTFDMVTKIESDPLVRHIDSDVR